MKHYKFSLVLAIAIVFGACSDDETIERPVYHSKDFQGEWFCQENATFLKISYTNFNGTIYSDMESESKIEMNIIGKWTFFPTNSIVRMNMSYAKHSETRDYKVLKVDKNTLELVDIDFNTKFVYHKVIGECELAIGENFDISVNDFTPSLYSTISPTIAKIDNQGHVKALNKGTTFVKAESGSDIVYAKINVIRVPCYLQELFSTIDKIIERLGEPDDIILIDENNPNSNLEAIYKTSSSIKDLGLVYLYYVYDKDTREISIISTYYKTPSIFNDDLLYIKDKYYDVYRDSSVYGANAGIVKNDFFIEVYIDENMAFTSYLNQLYFWQNGKYY